MAGTETEQDASLAVFCDFENIALGVRDAKYPSFDMQLVLERLLLKGSIVTKKAYCDWERYKSFKPVMHEAAFELIEIPHTRQSGKNSADIRMVVDALDLCYTKSHIDTFVIVSGDSDFSPLVAKLRENARTVIGVGVKNSTSDLLMNSCDEFIYYDDLVRAAKPAATRRRRVRKKAAPKPAAPADGEAAESTAETARPAPSERDRVEEGIELVVETADALLGERAERIWGSMVKQTLKRRRPGFNEAFYGFRSFSELLEAARDRGLMEIEPDERSGGYVIHAVRREG